MAATAIYLLADRSDTTAVIKPATEASRPLRAVMRAAMSPVDMPAEGSATVVGMATTDHTTVTAGDGGGGIVVPPGLTVAKAVSGTVRITGTADGTVVGEGFGLYWYEADKATQANPAMSNIGPEISSTRASRIEERRPGGDSAAMTGIVPHPAGKRIDGLLTAASAAA